MVTIKQIFCLVTVTGSLSPVLTSHAADDDLMTESEPDNSPPLGSDGRSQGASSGGLTPAAPAPMVGMEPRWPRPALTQHRLPDTSPGQQPDTGPGHWQASWSPSSHEPGLSTSWKSFNYQNVCKRRVSMNTNQRMRFKSDFCSSYQWYLLDFLILNISMFELLAKQFRYFELTQRL